MSGAAQLIGLGLLVATGALASATTTSSRATVASSATETRPLLIGQRIPAATVKDLDGRSVDLGDLLKKRQSVLVFFRGGWCPYCNKQLSQLQSSLGALKTLGYQVIAISPDTPHQLRGFRSEKGLEFDIYSDLEGEATKRFGLAYKVGPQDFGGESYFTSWREAGPPSRAQDPFLPVPAVYLVNPGHTIFYQYVNVDVRVRLSAEVLLTAARVYGVR